MPTRPCCQNRRRWSGCREVRITKIERVVGVGKAGRQEIDRRHRESRRMEQCAARRIAAITVPDRVGERCIGRCRGGEADRSGGGKKQFSIGLAPMVTVNFRRKRRATPGKGDRSVAAAGESLAAPRSARTVRARQLARVEVVSPIRRPEARLRLAKVSGDVRRERRSRRGTRAAEASNPRQQFDALGHPETRGFAVDIHLLGDR